MGDLLDDLGGDLCGDFNIPAEDIVQLESFFCVSYSKLNIIKLFLLGKIFERNLAAGLPFGEVKVLFSVELDHI